jgi:large subunit ribosomal protein L21
MYAIIEVGKKQFSVEPGIEIKVPHINKPEGSNIAIENVLLFRNNDETMVGKPFVPGLAIDATIVRHDRYKKIIIFKKKRRKGYKLKKGHRQSYTLLRINQINLNPSVEKPVKKRRTTKKTKDKAEKENS